jgi:hypothetical protein
MSGSPANHNHGHHQSGAPTPEMLERAQDLIIARATIGLSPAEGEELRDLLETIGAEETRTLEGAVEATRSAVFAESAAGALPAGLRERLAATMNPDTSNGVIERIGDGSSTGMRGGRGARLPWALAAAAFVLAGVTVVALKPWVKPGPVGPDIATIDRTADTVRWPFKPNVGEYGNASGEVVWSESLQRGYMRLKGVSPNDPKVRQYQLWIVDPVRDTHPVDGGVFNITSTGEVIVPFEARLPVRGAAAFAITSEKPGGVVVSAGPLLIVASKP